MKKFKYEHTDAFIHAVTEYLEESFGQVKPQWRAIVELLGDEHDMYIKAQETLDRDGYTITTGHGMQPHPAVKMMQDAAIQQQKLMTALGLTPSAALKLKLTSARDLEEEEEVDYLDELVK